MAQENLRETLGLEQVVELREKTEKISRSLLGQLRDYLDTLRPLLAPARVFGKHVRSPVREDVPDAETALKKLCEKYNGICAKPFSLPPNLGNDAVADLDGAWSSILGNIPMRRRTTIKPRLSQYPHR